MYFLKCIRCVKPFVLSAPVRAEGGGGAALGAWMASTAALQAHGACCGVSAVLRAPSARSTRAEEAQDRGTFSRALQETQCRHGEQDNAATEESG